MNKGRFVLDTNVLLSTLLFPVGRLSWIRHAWQSEAFRPLASRNTVEELMRVICYPKFRLTDEDRQDLLEDYLPWCESILVPDILEVPSCRDPWDRPFLQLALAGEAEGLVTGDQDLLVLADTFSVPIIPPVRFRHLLFPS